MAKAARSKLTAKHKLEQLLNSKATVSPDELHEASEGQLGGRNSIYDACARGDYDCSIRQANYMSGVQRRTMA